MDTPLPAPIPLAPEASPPRVRQKPPPRDLYAASAMPEPAIRPIEFVRVAREGLNAIITHHAATLHQYVNGQVPPEIFACLVTEVEELLFYKGETKTMNGKMDFMAGIDQLRQLIDGSIQLSRFLVPDEYGKFHYPDERELEIFATRLGWKPSRLLFTVKAAALQQEERTNRIQWSEEPLKRLERMLRMAMAYGGNKNGFSPHDRIQAALDHMQATKGQYADQTTVRTARGWALPIDDVVDFLQMGVAFGDRVFGDKGTHGQPLWLADIYSLVLDASWGTEQVRVPSYVVRKEYKKMPRGRWWFSTQVKGRDLAARAIDAERSGDLVQSAIIYTMLAQTHLYGKEVKKGYYTFVQELFKEKDVEEPPSGGLPKVDVHIMTKAEHFHSAKRKAALQKAGKFLESDPRMMTAEDWLKDFESRTSDSMVLARAVEKNMKSVAFAHSMMTPFEDGPKMPAAGPSAEPYRKLWLAPQDELRRVLYGISAARAWMNAGDARSDDDPAQAQWCYQMGQHVLEVARSRMPIVLSCPKEAQEALGVNFADVVNPLRMGLSVGGIHSMIADRVMGVQAFFAQLSSPLNSLNLSSPRIFGK